MHLTPKELEKLMLHGAGFLAQKRLWRGLRLNYPEATALLATQLLEFIRDGETVAELMEKGKRLLGFADVLPGVADMLEDVQVEGTFPDGVKLVTVHFPICTDNGDLDLALYGSGLIPNPTTFEKRYSGAYNETEGLETVPGDQSLMEGYLELNEEREVLSLAVTNTGDRPVQVGSHYPFFEVNAALLFDRARALGFRLNIPSGTAVRFEPGEAKKVELVALAGERLIYGGNGLIQGAWNAEDAEKLADAAQQQGFRHEKEGRE